VIVYYNSIYTKGLHPEARFPRDRYRLLAERLEPNPGIELKRPAPITREDLILAHDPDFVDRFLNGQLSEKKIRSIGLRPWTDHIVARTLKLTGGSLLAMEKALASGGIARSMATQHITREKRNSLLPLQTSHIPASLSRQCSQR